jgi:hypothetical protein
LSGTPPPGTTCDMQRLASCGDDSTACVSTSGDCASACLSVGPRCTASCQNQICACAATHNLCARSINCYTDELKPIIDSVISLYRGISACGATTAPSRLTGAPSGDTPIAPLSSAERVNPISLSLMLGLLLLAL